MKFHKNIFILLMAIASLSSLKAMQQASSPILTTEKQLLIKNIPSAYFQVYLLLKNYDPDAATCVACAIMLTTVKDDGVEKFYKTISTILNNTKLGKGKHNHVELMNAIDQEIKTKNLDLCHIIQVLKQALIQSGISLVSIRGGSYFETLRITERCVDNMLYDETILHALCTTYKKNYFDNQYYAKRDGKTDKLMDLAQFKKNRLVLIKIIFEVAGKDAHDLFCAKDEFGYTALEIIRTDSLELTDIFSEEFINTFSDLFGHRRRRNYGLMPHDQELANSLREAEKKYCSPNNECSIQ